MGLNMKFFKSLFRGLYSEEISEYQDQINSVQKSLDEKNQTIKNLREKKKELETNLRSSNVENSNLKIQIRTLIEKIATKDSLLSDKKLRITDLENTLNELDRDNHKLIQSRKELEAKIRFQKEDIAKLNEQFCSLQDKMSVKEAKLSEIKNIVQNLETELAERLSENTEVSIKTDAYKRQIESLESELKAAHGIIDDIKRGLEEEKSRHHCTEIELSEVRNQNEKLTVLNSEFDGVIKELESQIAKSREEISYWKEEKEAQEEKLLEKEVELQESSKRTISLEKDLNELQTDISRLTVCRDELESLLSRVKELEVENQNLLAELNELRNKSIDEELLAALKDDLKEKLHTIEKQELEIQHLNENLSSLHVEKTMIDTLLAEKNQECEGLKSELRSISKELDEIGNIRRAFREAEKRIAELQNAVKSAPSPIELIKRDKEIEILKSKLKEYQNKGESEDLKVPINEDNQRPQSYSNNSQINSQKEDSATGRESISHRPRYRKPKFPYRRRPIAPSKDVVTIDFPTIENDNVYSQTARLIDTVFNHRSNSLVSANSIFLHKSVEEISKIRFELEEASRIGVPYLTCPCCGNMVKISSRSIGFGSNRKEVQFFTHAVKNVPCDLKRENSYSVKIDEGETSVSDFSYLKELRSVLADSLKTEISIKKGVSNVESNIYIFSDELPIMKRRLADVSARYNDIEIVFELVTPTTHIARVHDRDIFYLINRRQVFWIFGLESIVDYNELRRSVSKDIFFTNKRNVFVFDIEAQNESRQRGELMLKCNWLDEDGEWYYQIDKNGKNGILISLDQIHFDEEGCRPYFYDADEPFYLKHPTADRPLKLSREEVKEEIIESWNYDQQRSRVTDEMVREKRGVQTYSDGLKWGFKYGDTIFVEPLFTTQPIFQGDFAKVEKDGKYGVVDRYGDFLLQPDYLRVEIMPNGYILYSSGDYWYMYGTIDFLTSYSSDDEIIVETISRRSSIYHLIIKKTLFKGQQPEEFYFIGKEVFRKSNFSGKWSLWQSNGEKVTDVFWENLEFTSDDRIKVSSNGRTQVLALDGTVIEDQRYKSEIKLSNGNSIVESFDRLWGIIDNDGLEIVIPEYDVIVVLDDKYLKVRKDNQWGIITSSGDVITDFIFRSVDGFDGRFFTVTKPDKTKGWGSVSGKIDTTGKDVSEIISRLSDDLIITKSFEKYGLKKHSGFVIIPHIYDHLSYWGDNKFIAKKNNKYGIIDSRNWILLDFEYSSITPLKDGKSTIMKGTTRNEIDSNLKIVEEEVIELQEGYKKIKLGGKWGILNPEGQVIVDYLYDEISTFRGRLVGIINGRLIKLNAYYPYRLQMTSEKRESKDSRDIVSIGGVSFQILNSKNENNSIEPLEVVLINWTSGMKYPIVLPYNKAKHNRKSKHIDKPNDFIIGECYNAVVTGYRTKKDKIKGWYINLSGGKISYIFPRDLEYSGISQDTIKIGDKLMIHKIGFDEELDRTLWKIEKSK